MTGHERCQSPTNSGSVVLEVNIAARVDTFRLQAEFEVPAGGTTAIVGPNGSGKSTLMAVLAGFLAAEAGTITFDGRRLDEPESGVFVPPERRPVAIVPQGGVLLPHLTVLANVAYGLRHRRRDLSRDQRTELAVAALEDVGLAELRDRRPDELSGGQAQRAAVARALVLEAPVLLLDEPLSNIDVDNRQLIRKLLQVKRPPQQIQVVVTHGPDHATDADDLVVLENGCVAARGTPAQLRAKPPSAWLAELLGP